MNKKPVIFRSVFAIIVVAVFAVSIYPLYPRNFFTTFQEMLKNKDEKIESVIKTAKEKMAKNPSLYESVALLETADNQGVDLTKYVNGKGLVDNRDVISLIRSNASSSIRLGLDLNGGVEFLLELVPDNQKAEEKAKDSKGYDTSFNRYRDIAIEVLRNRLESQNINESEISPAGGKYISLRVPVVSKDEKLKLLKLIQMSAKLQFRLVSKENDRYVSQFLSNPKDFVPPVGYERMSIVQTTPGEKPQKQYYFVKKTPEMDGKNIVNAGPYMDEFGRREIRLRFNAAGAKQFGDVTAANVGRQLAIVLDGKLYSAPNIRGAIPGGNAVITGNFSREESENISNALVSGSLPVRINVEAVFDTDPTLGKEAVINGTYAGIVALIAVILFMVLYYLVAGAVADIALMANIVLVLGALAAFEATLTLPGIAGIILTIGMSVDANVLIFERIREELRSGKTLLNAIDKGYSRAFTTILDANLTTLFTALILMWQGTGAIKGFAVTLSIGILTSMFTALFLTRLIFDILARSESFKKLRMCQLFEEPKINFLGMRKGAATLSGLLIAGAILVVAVRGTGIFGIDFTGGTQLLLPYEKHVPMDDVKQVLSSKGYKGVKVTYKTSFAAQDDKKNLEIIIRDDNISQEQKDSGTITSPMQDIVNLLNEKFPDAKFGNGSESSLGGLIGWQFTKSAIIAFICAIIGIVIYISIRFEFTYAIAAIIALVHDVIISTGIYLACGRELSLPVIAALLTIIGYSLNDTIVVFDRIREDLELVKDKTYKEIINLSINQTLGRTLLTSITTALVLVILFFTGGVAINDFVFVMLTGVIVGTYSSIFVASPIVAVWHKHIGSKAKDE